MMPINNSFKLKINLIDLGSFNEKINFIISPNKYESNDNFSCIEEFEIDNMKRYEDTYKFFYFDGETTNMNASNLEKAFMDRSYIKKDMVLFLEYNRNNQYLKLYSENRKVDLYQEL